MSDKPVAERLQVKPGRRLAVLAAPTGLDSLIGAEQARTELADADVVLVFAHNCAELDVQLASLHAHARADAILWAAYPKLTSRLAGDLNRDIVRTAANAHGLDTVSQIAIDADWSALRLKRVPKA